MCNFVLMLLGKKKLYCILFYIKVACNFILLLICKFLKQNKNIEIKKKKKHSIVELKKKKKHSIVEFF